MSIQSEITRIQSAKNTLRAKAVALGVGLTTDNLTQLATKYDGIEDRGTPNATVKEGESYTILEGYYHGGTVNGVAGGGNYSLQAKSFTPTKTETTVTSDDGYYGLSGVTVAAIPDMYQDVTDVTATAADGSKKSAKITLNVKDERRASNPTAEEKKEQALLRQEYVASVKANLRNQLNNIDMMNADGSVENLGEKYGSKTRTS